jgi:hypothetical protein
MMQLLRVRVQFFFERAHDATRHEHWLRASSRQVAVVSASRTRRMRNGIRRDAAMRWSPVFMRPAGHRRHRARFDAARASSASRSHQSTTTSVPATMSSVPIADFIVSGS